LNSVRLEVPVTSDPRLGASIRAEDEVTAVGKEYEYMHTHTGRDSFGLGLFTGALVGAGLAMWLTPWSAGELRKRITEGAKPLGQRASDQYRRTNVRVADASDEFANTIQDAPAMTTPVARGADEVGRLSTVLTNNQGIDRQEATIDRRPL
jgi:gas vesicle protein